VVVLKGNPPSRPERSHQLPDVLFRLGEEQEHPAREHEVVVLPGQGCAQEIALEDPPGAEASRVERRLSLRQKTAERSTASTGPPTRRRSSRWSEASPGPTSSTRWPDRIRSRSKRERETGSQSRACTRRREVSRRESPSRYRYFMTKGVATESVRPSVSCAQNRSRHGRRSRKKSTSMFRHSSSRTPETASKRWFTARAPTSSSERTAPNFGSGVP
jgi:hypothetical protein